MRIDLGIGAEFDALEGALHLHVLVRIVAFLVPELISKQLEVGLDVGCPPP